MGLQASASLVVMVDTVGDHPNNPFPCSSLSSLITELDALISGKVGHSASL